MSDLRKLLPRLFRFRLITMLVGISVVAAICTSRPAVQLHVLQEIRQLRGSDSLSNADASRSISSIKSEIVSDAFRKVHSMMLADVRAKPHWIRAMKDWDELSMLWLNRSGVTDSEMRYLANHGKLIELYLNGNCITDQGVRNLGTINSLQRLELNYTNVRTLSELGQSFPKLWLLKLRGTQISDFELSGLRSIRSLLQLDLSRTQVTDSGLEFLESMPQLELIRLEESHSTRSGAQRLHSRLPHCTVYATDGTCFVGK